jgi:type VI secretion system secreted protein Hcp
MAVDMFLKIDGIDGGSTDHKHKEQIEVLSYSWGLTQTLGSGGGGGAGKVNVSDFSIVKQIDASSPKLMEACCTGQHIRDVTMTLVNKSGVDSVSFNFTNVDIQAADKNGKFVSQVSCNFAKIDGQLGHNH